MKNRLLKALIIALGAALCVLIFAPAAMFQNETPSVVQYNFDLNSGAKMLTVKRTAKMIERIDDVTVSEPSLSFCAELDEVKVKTIPVTPVAVNDIYFKNYNISVKDFGKNSAVISDELSLKLFFTRNGAGHKLEMNGKKYTVAGVYPSGSKYERDSRERVYVDYSGADCDSASVCELAAANATPACTALEQAGIAGYIPTDFGQKKSVIGDFSQITVLILYIVLLIFALRLWKRVCGSQWRKLREVKAERYFLEGLRTAPKNYLVFIIAGVGIPAALIAVFLLCRFNFFIIPAYMPDDNIFDIPHYLERWTEAKQSLNAAALAGNTYLLRLYQSMFDGMLFKTAGVIIAAILSVISF